jgi:hypothetical protein
MSELPWEVELLLMIAKEDRERYETYYNFFRERFTNGKMSECQFRRLATALAQVAKTHQREYGAAKRIVHKADNPGIRLVKS